MNIVIALILGAVNIFQRSKSNQNVSFFNSILNVAYIKPFWDIYVKTISLKEPYHVYLSDYILGYYCLQKCSSFMYRIINF